MAIGDLVYPADIAQKPEPRPEHHHHHHHHCPECPPPVPMWFVPPPVPMPIPADYPHYDPYHHHDHHGKDDDDKKDDEDKDAIKASIEMQICRLAKQAATIKIMIDCFKNKNKDAILRIASTSYNFGPYTKIVKDEDGKDVTIETEYGAIILEMLTNELALIKEKISELAGQLELEESLASLINGIYTTVTQD